MCELMDIDSTTQEPISVTQVNSFTKKILFSCGMYKYLIKSQIQ